jgi:uncharacterized protein (DUF58 family)
LAFDPGFIRTLEALNLLAKRLLAGEERAERQTPRRGASIEFADYRRYAPGDEIRYIDWNVYARHGTLFVKEFTAEEDVHVALLVDTSRSMAFAGKLAAAKELAAALGYIGLVNFDTVSLYGFADALRPVKKLLRGKGTIFELLGAIDGLDAAGASDWRGALAAPIARLKGRSLVFILTDFYDAGYAEAVRSLLAQRHQVNLIHLVTRQEIEPVERGRTLLVDLETGRERDLTLTPGVLDQYRRRLMAYCGEIEAFATRHETYYARIRADEPLEQRVRDLLRRGGILELR